NLNLSWSDGAGTRVWVAQNLSSGPDTLNFINSDANGNSNVLSLFQTGYVQVALSGFAVGSAAVNPGAGVVNVTNGYRIGNAASASNALCGNGTNFVASGACTLSTSLTVPQIYGGSAASSTLTISSTSGAGTTDAIVIQTASQTNRVRITTGGLVNVGTDVT